MFSDRTSWRLAQNRFTQAVEETRAREGHLLDLTAANPTRVGLHYDSGAILGSLASPRALDYDPQARGILEARQAVSRYYAVNLPGLISAREVDPERIILTASTSEGYSHVFRLLCNAGDELLVPKPSYPLFEFLADLQDVKLLPYPLIYDHGWQMDFHSLEKTVTPRTRGVVLVHPNNPTGSYVHAAERHSLNAFCQSHSLALIADEVFLDYRLSHSENEHAGTAAFGCPDGPNSAASPASSFVFNEDVLTFTLSGLSKISALPQMKVAWIVTSGPKSQVDPAMARLEIIADTYLSMNAPIQWAVPTMLDQRSSIQAQLMDRVRRNLAELDRQLATQKSCQRLHLEGGWYAVLRVPVTRSDEDLAIQLVREKSVLVHPGHFYDFESDGYLVLSLISQGEEFGEGCRRMLGYLNS
jgi:aspartate/methionine/tyrosine aminotransferase